MSTPIVLVGSQIGSDVEYVMHDHTLVIFLTCSRVEREEAMDSSMEREEAMAR